MSQTRVQIFTAAQIARSLGKSKRAVWRVLESVKPTTMMIVSGGEAAGWSLDVLPPALRTALDTEAKRRGYRDALHLLTDPTKPWEPPVPLSQVAGKFVERANLLRDALAKPLARQHQLSSSDLISLGLEEFAHAFGYKVSAKHWQRLFDRAVDRDGGYEKWDRLDLYVDDAAFPRARKPTRRNSVFSHQPIDIAIAGLQNRREPTREDAAWLFHNTFRHYERLIAEGHAEREVKSSILDHLEGCFEVPLCKSSAALRRTFDNKLLRWIKGGRTYESLLDLRPLRSGRPSYTCPECETKVNHQARQLRGQGGTKGNTSLAWRLLWNNDEICPRCKERYSFNMRKNKSYVPRNFRLRAAPRELEIAADRGWKHARDIGPYIPGDHSDTEAGDCFTLDDETPNQIIYEYVAGEEIPLIGAAQNIEGIDARCFMPLEFYMYIGAPSALAIRRALWGVFSKVGIPHRELILERGVFAARMIIGDDEPSWRETEAEFETHLDLQITGVEEKERERGIREAGIDLHQARVHRGKPIEGHFNHTQKRASLLPGTAGNRQRDEIPDHLKEFVARCKVGKEHPGNELLSLDELRKNYRAIREEYMHTPQNGNKLRGATPFEMWSERLNRKPLRQLPPELEYLVSTHKQIRPLREHAIEIKASNYEKAIYSSPELGSWYAARVREVLVFRNIFDLSKITVSDMKRQSFLSVPRVLLPSRTATKEGLKQAHGLTRGFIAEATGGFGKLTHPLSYTIIRDNDHTEAQKALGRFHVEAVEKQKAEETDEQKMVREIRKLEGQLEETPKDLNTVRNAAQYLDSLRWRMENRKGRTTTATQANPTP